MKGMQVFKSLAVTVATILIVITGLLAVIYLITFHPKPVQAATLVCPAQTPTLMAGQDVRVLNYNVQYFAGKDYIFYYDVADNAGPHTRPSPDAITSTFVGISELILEQNPDVLILQEIHDGAKATDYENQTERLLSLLQGQYPCYSEAFYWQAKFVPHGSIMGSVGMKLVTLSKYKIETSHRYALSQMSTDFITKAFNLKRAIMTSELPVSNGTTFTVLNTHLDAFSQGMNTMELQVAEVGGLLAETKSPWVIGGDFNLLPPQHYEDLPESQQIWYNPQTEITPLLSLYQSVPSLENLNSVERHEWYTHYPNDPQVSGPDRTIDYLFYSSTLGLQTSQVIRGKALTLSDHLPVVATFQLP